MSTSKPPITDDQIRSLRREAAIAGDSAQVRMCDAALSGDEDAAIDCIAAIDRAADMDDDDAPRPVPFEEYTTHGDLGYYGDDAQLAPPAASTNPVRTQPYPALMERFRYAARGDSPAGVDPRLAPWFWAAYDDSPKAGDLDCKRDAARLLADALPEALALAPTLDESGWLIRPRTRTDERCDEIAATRSERPA